MLIRDLEQKTGLDRATIRFYEREGLITPQRKENGYREYSEEDLVHLKKILLLRQLGISLETIQGLQKGTEDFGAALSEQIQILENQIQKQENAKEVCTQIFRENTSYAELNADFYLQKLNGLTHSQSKTRSAEPQVFHEPVRRPYHPVRRFLARMTDYAILRILLIFFLVVVLRLRPFSRLLSVLIVFGVPILIVPLGAIMLHMWGTTPGKWLYGLSVLSENGNKLSYEEALYRERNAWKNGYGFGIPGWSIYRMYKSYMYYGDFELDWDRETEYQYHIMERKRIVSLTAVVILLVGMNIWSSTDMLKPKHRGEITVAQFAENYNFYQTLLDKNADRTARLQSDGIFYPPSANTVVIDMTGTRISGDGNFQYTASEGKLRSIHYESAWADVVVFSPKPTCCTIAAITVLMSQNGMGKADMLKFAELLDRADFTQDGNVKYKNIEISWSVEADNCVVISNSALITDDDTQPSFASVTYDILIHSK